MDYNTQIVVIGGGASGMAAAAAAAEAGAEVVVVEANAAVGGNGLFPRGIFGVDSVIQRRKLVFADADEIFKSCMEYSHWKIDGRLIRALIDKSGDTISWLAGKGVDFTDVVHHIPNQTPEVFHITDAAENVGMAVIKALRAYCAEKGVTILTGTRGKKLLLDEHGAVRGVLCEDKQGGSVTVTAEKAIVCTGGFAGNPELVAKFYPTYNPAVVSVGGGMRHQGDGVLMATEAGADIEGNFAMEMAAPKLKGNYAGLNLLIGKPYHIWVNRFGRRFADEGIVYNFAQAANACMRQPDGAVWVLFDQSGFDRTLADGRDIIELIHIAPDAEERLAQTIGKAQEDGVLKVSGSLEELAKFIGCEAAELEESVSEYNACCDQHWDRLFAKQGRYLTRLDQPPYYALRAGTDMLITHGGIRVNEQFEALDSQFATVPNLYVAGVDFGGADADVYNVTMSGHGFGFAVNSGRIAGEHAAQAVTAE
ncbi:MAG: Succinate dehydrogenase/fumarate reductase, flavoprotein subunit [Oscillospiraceae bacterium]|nr:Succinate dehydrogenase/fumarate reductase, flavoprotein subunit [Oscillospiraceae bacterium]